MGVKLCPPKDRFNPLPVNEILLGNSAFGGRIQSSWITGNPNPVVSVLGEGQGGHRHMQEGGHVKRRAVGGVTCVQAKDRRPSGDAGGEAWDRLPQSPQEVPVLLATTLVSDFCPSEL